MRSIAVIWLQLCWMTFHEFFSRREWFSFFCSTSMTFRAVSRRMARTRIWSRTTTTWIFTSIQWSRWRLPERSYWGTCESRSSVQLEWSFTAHGSQHPNATLTWKSKSTAHNDDESDDRRSDRTCYGWVVWIYCSQHDHYCIHTLWGLILLGWDHESFLS